MLDAVADGRLATPTLPVRTVIRKSSISGSNIENLARQFKKFEQRLVNEAIQRRDELRTQELRRNRQSVSRSWHRQLDLNLRSPLFDAAITHLRSDTFRQLAAASEKMTELHDKLLPKRLFDYLEGDKQAFDIMRRFTAQFGEIVKK